MNCMVFAFEVFLYIMDLGMAIMAWSDTIPGTCVVNLFEFFPAVIPAFFRISGLQEAAASAATIIIGAVRGHVCEIFLAYNGFYDKSKVFRNGVAQCFSYQLAGILNGKLNFQVIVPIRVYLEFPLPDPLGIILNYTFAFEVVLDIEFVQSDPDCKKFMPSFRIEPHFAVKVIDSLGLHLYDILPTIEVLAKQAVVFGGPTF